MALKNPQLREMTAEELDQKKTVLKKELFELRHQVKIGRVDKPHKISLIKKEIARIETILRARQISSAAEKKGK